MGKMMINGSRILLESLHELGIEDIFGYPGGCVIPIYNELYDFDKIKHYSARHEQGAAHEADGYARASGKLGVCLATSGPGATNLVTGIMTAHMDSIPLLAITGQVGTGLLGKDAFQESDIVGITLPITKMNYLVTDIRDLPRVIKEAHHIATTGRPGPVLVDIPRDIQLTEIPYDEFEKLLKEEVKLEGYSPNYKADPTKVREAVSLIKESKKPLIISGAGVLKSGAHKELSKFVEKTKIPVTQTLLGLGSFPGEHELSLGMPGMHGTVPANYATKETDLLIAVGMRFDDRITGNPKEFCEKARIIHIDIDPAEIGKNKKVDIAIIGDAKDVLSSFNNETWELDNPDWLEQIKEWKRDYPMAYGEGKEGKLMPQEVLTELSKTINGEAIVATDVGQHQMWSAQFLTFNNPNTILTSGGSGTMGYGLPAAIGAQVAMPDKKVVAVVGDGGFQMTFQELMLVKQYNLPVKVVIINNSYLGMVRQWQELFNEKRYSGVDLEVNPDFGKIAEAYGIKFITIENREDLDGKLREAIESNEPVIMNCIVEKEANVFPMIPAGGNVSNMVGKGGVLEDE